MRLTVLGGCGAWPAAGSGCSGYLVDHDGFRLLLDPGYATVPRLFELIDADEVDAVFVSHGHPDHCADLNPLLRARALRSDPPPPLPVYALPGAVDAVLALDHPRLLAAACTTVPVGPGDRIEIGPFTARTWALPHFVPNLGIRLEVGGPGAGRTVLAYTGDTGPSTDIAALARGADLLLAEATYPVEVPAASAAYLSSARQAGRNADRAGAGALVLTHLWPGTDPVAALTAAAEGYEGPIEVAEPGLVRLVT